jgi:hypothetical protein
MNEKLVWLEGSPGGNEAIHSPKTRAVYETPRLEVTGSFVTLTGVTLSIGALFDDSDGGE